MKTKKCSRCGSVLSIDKFYSSGKGEGKTKAECKECSKKLRRASTIRKRELKDEIVLTPKRSNVVCKDCKGLGVYCKIEPSNFSTNFALYCNSFKSKHGSSNK